jgi:prepilin peptidase CpaA
MELYRSWILIGLVLFVAQSDLRQYRISNRSVLITLVSGIAWNIGLFSSQGFLISCLGILAGFALLIPFYILGGMTAGDVKWLAALGAWYGPKGILGVFLVSGLALGLIALVMFATNAIATNKQKSPATTPEQVRSGAGIDEIFESPGKRRRLIPYAFPVALGVMIIECTRMIAAAF